MAISLSSDSLVTLEEYRVFKDAGFPITANQSGSYAQVLNLGAGYIKSYTDRTFLSGSLQQEVFSGEGYHWRYDQQHSQYETMQAPILNNPILYEYASDDWEVSSATILFNAGEYFENGGLIYFPGTERFPNEGFEPGKLGLTSDFFVAGTNNFRIDYEYGYTIDTVPEELKFVQMSLARYYEMIAAYIGVTGNTSGVATKSYNLDEPPSHILTILDKYRR